MTLSSSPRGWWVCPEVGSSLSCPGWCPTHCWWVVGACSPRSMSHSLFSSWLAWTWPHLHPQWASGAPSLGEHFAPPLAFYRKRLWVTGTLHPPEKGTLFQSWREGQAPSTGLLEDPFPGTDAWWPLPLPQESLLSVFLSAASAAHFIHSGILPSQTSKGSWPQTVGEEHPSLAPEPSWCFRWVMGLQKAPWWGQSAGWLWMWLSAVCAEGPGCLMVVCGVCFLLWLPAIGCTVWSLPFSREQLLNTVVMMQDSENTVLILHTWGWRKKEDTFFALSFSLAWKPPFYFYLFLVTL